MGLKKRLKKKVNKYYDKAKDYISKPIDLTKKVISKDPIVGQFMDKDSESSSPAPASPQYELKDVARSRAAGSGVFNYTDQEMKLK